MDIKLKKFSWLFVTLISCWFNIPAHSQFTFTPEGRLALSGKIWGFIKFHHTEVKAKRVNWDSVLLANINLLEFASTPEQFNDGISAIIAAAGVMRPTTTPSVPETGLNVDFEWIQDPLLNASNISNLNYIKDHFVADTNAWVYVDPNTGPNYIRMTNENNANLTQPLPIKSYRRLMLFRLWNLVNYYFPYKHDMTIPWDQSFMDLIPAFDTVTSALSYHLAIALFATRLNDSHAAYVNSALLSAHRKFNTNLAQPVYLKHIENKAVIFKLFADVPGLKVGDIIRKINGMDFDSLRIEYRKYFSASNESAGNRNALEDMVTTYGVPSAVFTIEDENGNVKDVHSHINIPAGPFIDSIYQCSWCGPVYGINECGYGYVNMGKLLQQDVMPMYEQLKNTPAIIFDIRNYPNGTLYAIGQAMYAASVPFVKFHTPVSFFPGDYYNEVYENFAINGNPNAYKGKVYVLVNEVTQSHAEFTAMHLQSMTNGKVTTIGSTTAGADGNITTFTLPGGINLTFTGLAVYYPDGSKTQRVGIRYDTLVRPTIKGVREGRDEVLEAALDCLTGTDHVSQKENAIQISPNPAEDWIQIKCDKQKSQQPFLYAIYDTSGKLVESNSIQSLPARLNVYHLNSGVYRLQLKSGDEFYSGKIIRM